MKHHLIVALLMIVASNACNGAAAPAEGERAARDREDSVSKETYYCKRGVDVKKENGVYREQKIYTDIRTPTRNLLVSEYENFFKIYLSHCTARDLQRPELKSPCPGADDAVTIEENNGIYHLELKRKGELVAKGDLKFAPSDAPWLVGDAILAPVAPDTEGEHVGMFYLYARPEQTKCRHEGDIKDRPCRSIFLEYFATADTHSNKYLPTMSGSNPTVTGGTCPAGGGGAETGDGEGDHGPVKP